MPKKTNHYYKIGEKSGVFTICYSKEDALKQRSYIQSLGSKGVYIRKKKGPTYLSDY
jgi:hypothetical protein